MNEVKIIPYMEIKDSRVDKGMRFTELRDASDPVEAAQTYCLERVDELVFLDIFATVEDGKTRIECIKRVCDVVTVPFTVWRWIFRLLSRAAREGLSTFMRR